MFRKSSSNQKIYKYKLLKLKTYGKKDDIKEVKIQPNDEKSIYKSYTWKKKDIHRIYIELLQLNNKNMNKGEVQWLSCL